MESLIMIKNWYTWGQNVRTVQMIAVKSGLLSVITIYYKSLLAQFVKRTRYQYVELKNLRLSFVDCFQMVFFCISSVFVLFLVD